MNAAAEPQRTAHDPVAELGQAGATQDAAASTTPQPGLLDTLTLGVREPTAADTQRWERFLTAADAAAALQEWFGQRLFPSKRELLTELNRHIGLLDDWLNRQLNAILHHASFQQLEASWRGLSYLTEKAWREDDRDRPSVKIKVLNVSRKELQRDLENALEFDQSDTFRKVYEQEYGAAGGEPFGVLLGDYEFRAHSGDYDMLDSMSQVAAAAFCPFITNASPQLFGLDDFAEMERHLDHEKTFAGLEYLRWQSIRQKEDARFLGLMLPRVLMRLPHADGTQRADGFRFYEEVTGPDRSRYLWGGAAYAFGANLIRAFAETGWLAEIHGVHRDLDGGGLVTDLPVHCFATDRTGIAPRSSTNVVITDELEKRLAELGFISLCDCHDTPYSAFYSTPSLQLPKKYDRALATTNARVSATIHSMLCVSRFAHYLKVISRDRIGGATDPDDLEDFLQRWLADYVTPDADASRDVRARRPLREAQVQVTAMRGQAGAFEAVVHLLPHHEIEGISTGIRLVARLQGVRNE